MGYGSNSNEIKEGAALGVGIHKGIFLKSVEKSESTEGKIWEALDYRFENSKGDYYTYRIFNPDGGDDPEKVAKAQKGASDKVVYIAKKLSNKDVELANVNSFESFINAAKAILPDNFNKISLEIKLVGNVYGGRANVQAPNIVNGGFIGGGWITREDRNEPIVLSAQDNKSINEYNAFNANTSKSNSLGLDTHLPDEEVVF